MTIIQSNRIEAKAAGYRFPDGTVLPMAEAAEIIVQYAKGESSGGRFHGYGEGAILWDGIAVESPAFIRWSFYRGQIHAVHLNSSAGSPMVSIKL